MCSALYWDQSKLLFLVHTSKKMYVLECNNIGKQVTFKLFLFKAFWGLSYGYWFVRSPISISLHYDYAAIVLALFVWLIRWSGGNGEGRVIRTECLHPRLSVENGILFGYEGKIKNLENLLTLNQKPKFKCLSSTSMSKTHANFYPKNISDVVSKSSQKKENFKNLYWSWIR